MARFTQYRVFVTVFELGSISAAAQQLNLSPSAVSKQISALETHLNIRLFERSNRNVKATASGRAFYGRCKTIIRDVFEAERSLMEIKEAMSGSIRITLSKSLLRSNLFDQLSVFADLYPDIRFNIQASEQFEDLHETEIDFALRIGQLEDHSRLVAIPLRKVRPVFCATPEYLNKFGRPQSYAELSMHRFACMPLIELSQAVRSFLKKQKLLFDPQNHQVNEIETAYQMVVRNMCVGMMLDCSVEKEINQDILVDLFPDQPVPSKTLYLLYMKNEYLPVRNQVFKSFLKEAYQ